MRSDEALARAAARLRCAGVEAPEREARLLLGWTLGRDPALAAARDLGPRVADRFARAVARRAAREPFAYITGEREFYGLRLRVGPAVLIPRPETELLVAHALAWLGRGPAAVVDMGTGSGCIAVAVAVHDPGARVWAVDVSTAALAVCRRNAARHGVAGRVAAVAGDLWDADLPSELAGAVDAVLSNPPYVAPDEAAALAPEVVRWEPRLALVPPPPRGEAPTAATRPGRTAPAVAEMYRRLIAGARPWLRPGGLLALEVGAGHAAEVAAALAAHGFADVAALDDLAGVPRVVRGLAA